MLDALTRMARFCLLGYVLLAVVYTTFHRILAISGSALSFFDSPWSHYAWAERDYTFKQSSDTGLSLLVDISDALWPEDLSFSEAPFFFPVSELVRRLEMDHATRTPVQEATLLSKAFAGALHPTRIIPYYYRASSAVDADDVTITTLVTRNRFKVFRQLVERYRGPVSVTVHIPFPAHASLASLAPTHPSVVALQRLHALYTSSPLFATYVDVHLALSPFASSARGEGGATGGDDAGEGEGGRQFNVWRNVARLFARTEFVMMLDVDFAVCTDWRGAIREAVTVATASSSIEGGQTGDVIQRMRDGAAALVVPAFEYTDLADGVDQKTFPTDKEVRNQSIMSPRNDPNTLQSLIRLAQAHPPKVAPFHAAWAAGHSSTDYMRYFSIPPGSGEVYRVTQYQSGYEPYVIMSKRVSWCDERFTGYGANKAACLFEMYLSGVSFYVMADHFLIHQTHKYEEAARREEVSLLLCHSHSLLTKITQRKYNRKLYADFKEEACLRQVCGAVRAVYDIPDVLGRYLFRYAHEGVLHTPRGFNVQEECKKLKGVARIATQVCTNLLWSLVYQRRAPVTALGT